MNKRKAKREAYWLAANWLRSALDGAEILGEFELEEEGPTQDYLRMEAAMMEVIAVLERRGLP